MKKNDLKRNGLSLYIGVILICLGGLCVLDMIGIVNMEFVEHWWPLAVFIPCLIGVINKNANKTLCLIGLIISGCILAGKIFPGINFGGLIFAGILIFVGIRILFPNFLKNYENDLRSGFEKRFENKEETGVSDVDSNKEYTFNAETNTYEYNGNGTEKKFYNYHSPEEKSSFYDAKRHAPINAILGGRTIKVVGEPFGNCSMTALMGGVELDLSQAIINEDIRLECTAVMGGIDIRVPSNVRVRVNCTPLLGGVDDESKPPYNADENTPTIFVNATCIMGGIDIK